MAQNDIGIDLGTTTIIIAQEGQGVVLNQPSVVAVDTRKNCVLEAGDKALAMVGRTPNYISAIFPLKDGVPGRGRLCRAGRGSGAAGPGPDGLGVVGAADGRSRAQRRPAHG